ncbi:protein SSUH2 homolog isoform X2 [Biomphalaria glabrata]|uniref:Protein SSUH2 homolog isoform X2 n=1 Tax=Biomphalaria glabrata TaxID=6526 RepID=A0A9W3A3K2_BIOGL|nr:protein SSUH2 homolog isoform X2 [Biomphalaria glabrata]
MNIPNGYGSYPPAGGAGPGMNQGQGYPPPQGSTPSYHQGAPPPKEALARPNEEVEASAPPPDGLLDSLPGYTNIGFQGAFLPPPAYSEVAPAEPQNREAIRSVVTLTEEQAREAIIQFAAEHCCYGKGPAVEMKLNSLESSSAFHYTLETFGEGRSTKWKSQPYRGEGIIVTGPPPGAWDIQAQPGAMFQPSKLKVEVPNTASVKPCHVCHARGYKFCYSCMGSGRRECGMCNGTGRRSWYENGENIERPCGSCNFGWCTCFVCNGSGRIECYKCKGRASLRWYIELKITWKNHLEDHIVERTALPDELIRTVSGEVAFEETYPRVWPINHFPESEINAASNTLVSKHKSAFPTERILMQRHRVRIVPVTQVAYSYKDMNSCFFVYGFEHRVHAPDYPAKCCCGCTVI